MLLAACAAVDALVVAVAYVVVHLPQRPTPAVLAAAAMLIAYAATAAHALEPLPPRASGDDFWHDKGTWLAQRPWQRLPRLVGLAVLGGVNEVLGAVRLLPTVLLLSWFRCAPLAWLHADSEQRTAEEIRALVARAWHSGHPAVDWIGVGGGLSARRLPGDAEQ
jgi:hypothetical protein